MSNEMLTDDLNLGSAIESQAQKKKNQGISRG